MREEGALLEDKIIVGGKERKRERNKVDAEKGK